MEHYDVVIVGGGLAKRKYSYKFLMEKEEEQT